MLPWTASNRFLQSSIVSGRRHFSLAGSPRGTSRLKKIVLAISGTTASLYAIKYFYGGSDGQALNTSTFTKFNLASKVCVSPSSSIYTLRPQFETEVTSNIIAETFKRGIWSVQFKQPFLQIARNYTPLPSSRDEENGEIRVLFRQEKGGEMSKYLQGLQVGADIEVRGPYLELEIPEDVAEILFLAGGTGIAPALQVANMLKERAQTTMHVMWANKRREDCMGGVSDSSTGSKRTVSFFRWISNAVDADQGSSIGQCGTIVRLLDSLKSQGQSGQLTVDYFVDEENSLITLQALTNFLRRNDSSLTDELRKKKLILISGPDGFVEYLAGSYSGPLSGILGKMDPKEWQVVRLGDV